MGAIPSVKQTMLEVYKSGLQDSKLGFLSSYFKSKDSYFTNGELINIDMVRSSRRVMPVVKSLGGSSVQVTSSVFTGTQVRPPLYSAMNTVDVLELLQRRPGETEWQTNGASWTAQMANRLRDGHEVLVDMINRSVELQAAQVLQTGKVTLTDKDGNDAFVLDYGKNASEIVSVTSKWDAGGDPEKDIDGLAQDIADNGHVTCTTLIFGRKAWQSFFANAKIAKLINRDDYNMGNLVNEQRGLGEIYKGFINLGDFCFSLYVYSGTYEAFDTGAVTRYLDEKSVLVLPDLADLDFRLVHAVYPMIPTKNLFADLVPAEVKVNGRMRYYNKVIVDENGDSVSVKTAARPLCIPVSLDRWGVLKEVCA